MLDRTGVSHGLKLSPDAAQKSAFITHLGKFEWKVAPFGLALLPSYYSKAMQETLSGLEDFARNYMDDVIYIILHRNGALRAHQTSVPKIQRPQNETKISKMRIPQG